MDSSDWFGIDPRNGVMKLSQISPYDRALSKVEFENFPMSFGEKDRKAQCNLRTAYRSFFQEFVSTAEELVWERDDFKLKSVTSIDIHLENFLLDRESATFIDSKNGILFVMDWYVEILVYSKNSFLLPDIDHLHQRTANIETSWSETQWSN